MPNLVEQRFSELRRVMVEIIAARTSWSEDYIGKDQLDERVMAAMARVPRHQFVRFELQQFAYADMPLPIGYGKTISQPFMVALMSDLLDIKEDNSVLEIGTGLGYQSAVLAELAENVYTVEIIEELASEAQRRLQSEGYTNIHFRIGDGTHGWAKHAAYDRIIVTAAPELIPPALLQQLKAGGKMVVPAGLGGGQKLLIVEKDIEGKVHTRETIEVRFSPLTVSH